MSNKTRKKIVSFF